MPGSRAYSKGVSCDALGCDFLSHIEGIALQGSFLLPFKSDFAWSHAIRSKGTGLQSPAPPLLKSPPALYRDRTIAHYYVMSAIVCAYIVFGFAEWFRVFLSFFFILSALRTLEFIIIIQLIISLRVFFASLIK